MRVLSEVTVIPLSTEAIEHIVPLVKEVLFCYFACKWRQVEGGFRFTK
jgi:hypothetical protein